MMRQLVTAAVMWTGQNNLSTYAPGMDYIWDMLFMVLKCWHTNLRQCHTFAQCSTKCVKVATQKLKAVSHLCKLLCRMHYGSDIQISARERHTCSVTENVLRQVTHQHIVVSWRH